MTTTYSDFFTEQETACKCGCGLNNISPLLKQVLLTIRTHFGAPVIITSCVRCPAHNLRVGGVHNSTHTRGLAADIIVQGVNPSDVYDTICKLWPDSKGVGRYNSFTHIDVRDGKHRWSNFK